MKGRCLNPADRAYHNYGGRGIRVCDDWLEYPAFSVWAKANGYTDDLQIDRIDNDWHYEPSNCRWTTHQQNQLNTRQNRLITAFGETKPLAEWLRDPRCVNGREAVRCRLKSGWPPEKALTVPKLAFSEARRRWWG